MSGVNWLSGGNAWDPSIRGIYRLPAKLQAWDIGRAVGLFAAPDRVQPGFEFAVIEGLDQVVVGSEAESGQLVVDRILRGQHQDRRHRARAPHLGEQLGAAAVGQVDVEDHRVVALDGEAGAGVGHIAGPVAGKPRAREPALRRLRELVRVFHQQHAHAAFSSPSEPVTAW